MPPRPFAMITLAFRAPRREGAATNGPLPIESMTATVASGPYPTSHVAHARHFPVATAELERIALAVLDAAKRGGATAAETEVSQGIGLSVTVRKEAVE